MKHLVDYQPNVDKGKLIAVRSEVPKADVSSVSPASEHSLKSTGIDFLLRNNIHFSVIN